MTYRDFEWLVDRYPWVGNSVFVSYVRDIDTRDVIDAMTDGFSRTAIGLGSVDSSEWYSTIGAIKVDRWTVAFSSANFAGVTDEVELTPEILTDAKFVPGHDRGGWSARQGVSLAVHRPARIALRAG